MKKLILLSLFFLVSVSIYAQHKPLTDIVIPTDPDNQIKTEHKIDKKDIYEAFWGYPTRRISHNLGIEMPFINHNSWEITIALKPSESLSLISNAKTQDDYGLTKGITKLYIMIGESAYAIENWYYFDYIDNFLLTIEINKSIVEHISISGIQSIYCDTKNFIWFSDIEQVLWSKVAKTVYDKRKNLNKAN